MCEINFLMALGKGKKLNLKILQAFGKAVEESCITNTDGCGFFDDKQIHKQLAPFKMAADSAVLDKFKDSRFVVSHSRAATSGAKTERNVHPFSSDRFVWCHNGVIPMSWYKAKIKKFDIQVDSELIGYSAEKATGKTNHEKIVNACKSISGSMSVFIYDKLEGELFYIRRDGRFNFYLIEYEGNKYIYGCTCPNNMYKMVINKKIVHGFKVDDIRVVSSFVPMNESIYKLTAEGVKHLSSVEKSRDATYLAAPSYANPDDVWGVGAAFWIFIILVICVAVLLILASYPDLKPLIHSSAYNGVSCSDLISKLQTYCSNYLA